MAFAILGTPKPQFFDSSGAPLAGGTLTIWEPSTDLPKATYPTYDDAEALTNANDNPITLDGRGECDLWGIDSEDYKLTLKDSAGTTVWTTDDIFLPQDLSSQSSTTTNPIDITGGAFTLDVEALTTIEGNALAATDTFYVEDGGVSKGIEVQGMGMRVQLAQTTQTLAAADMNSIMEFTGTATLTLPLNATTALPIGTPVVLNMKHATQVLTVTADTSVTLVSVYHPAGTAAASDTLAAGGSAVLYKTAADVWVLSGDITT